MIITDFNPKHGHCSMTVESAEDLWTLRRLIAEGDIVVTRSSRVLKKEDEFSRPDKGERVKVTIALSVEEVHLDSSIERIRIRGSIVEARDETVKRSGSHSVTLTPGQALTLRKAAWTPFEIRLVRDPKRPSKRFILVAVDRREAGIGALAGSHLTITTTVESGLGGKMSEEASSRPYISKVADVIAQVSGEGDEVVVAGPGNFKSSMANQIRDRLRKNTVTVLEGLDLTGSDGVRALIKEPSFHNLAKDSLLVEIQRLVTEAVRRISSGDTRVAYALPRVKDAALAGAVEACAVSDDVFSAGVDENELVSVLNSVESKGGSVYMADSTLELGKQVSSFGGMVAILRFSVRP